MKRLTRVSAQKVLAAAAVSLAAANVVELLGARAWAQSAPVSVAPQGASAPLAARSAEHESTAPPVDPAFVARVLEHSPLPPLPPDPTNAWADDARAARLGQALFFDKRLSMNGAVACASCHDPARAFTDRRALSQGVGAGTRNTPALWNLAWQRWFFWDGRADTMWSQALGPIEAEHELASDRTTLARLVDSDPELSAAYEELFGPIDFADPGHFPAPARPMPERLEDPRDRAWRAMRDEDRAAVNRVFVNVGKSIAAYERKLVSRDSPFDRYAAALKSGDVEAQRAYPESARRGLALFLGKANCKLCHAGPTFTDNEFHNIGVGPLSPSRFTGVARVRESEFNASTTYSDAPHGERAGELAQLLGTSEVWGQVKTPSLRNVALTAPYMHQGQFETLERVMAYYSTLEGSAPAGHHGEKVLKPLELAPDEQRDLVAFLESLTDAAIDPALLAPPSAPRTGLPSR